MTRTARLMDLLIGSEADACTPPTQKVAFGRRYWLAQHRWLEPAVGLAALLPVAAVYALAFQVLQRPAAWALAAVWVAFAAGGLVLRTVRPCTVLRLPIHALIVWLVVVGTAPLTGLDS